MLCLTRKVGEKIVVNDNIVITLVEIAGGKVRLGIDAPREVPIFREELLTRGKYAEQTAHVNGNTGRQPEQ